MKPLIGSKFKSCRLTHVTCLLWLKNALVVVVSLFMQTTKASVFPLKLKNLHLCNVRFYCMISFMLRSRTLDEICYEKSIYKRWTVLQVGFVGLS